MTKQLVDILAELPTVHSNYIEDSELRDMAIVWAVHIRNENKLFEDSAYGKLLIEMNEKDPLLYRRFHDYLVSTFDGVVSRAEWSEPADRIRKTLLPK